MSSSQPPAPHSYHAVRWFLSAVILKKLKQITGNSLFANELNMRDWMAWPADIVHDQADEVWFDYLADTGDDSRVMEAIGHHLFVPFTIGARDGLLPDAQRALDRDEAGRDPAGTLPRGQFVVVGGDTAYVVADQTTLWERLVAPWQRAIAAVAPPAATDPLYDIVGIAGNHDYYDNLTGFNRMFRKRPPHDVHAPAKDHPALREPLPLPGFHRVQDATFLRIKLPGWELWGADFWNEAVDYRQQAYFRPDGAPAPRNLIVCTPTPPIANNGYTASATDIESFDRLLGPAFDPVKRLQGDNPADQRLLLLSGDTHHYERYMSTANGAAEPAARTISIVSGGGGAFSHPTETELGALKSTLKYPDAAISRSRSANALAWGIPTMFKAGLLWLVGGILAAGVVRFAPFEDAAALMHGAQLGAATTAERAALVFFGLIAGGGVIGYVSHAITLWVRTQRTRAYHWRLRSPERQPDRVYLALRNSVVTRGLASVGIVDDLGLIVRIAALTSAIWIPYLLRSLWLPDITVNSLMFVGLGVVFVVALTGLAVFVGAGDLHGAKKVIVALAGVGHGSFQFVLPILAITAGWSRDGALVLAGWLVFTVLARVLYHRGTLGAIAVALLWLAQGAALPALVWLHGVHTLAISQPGWTTIGLGFVAGALIAPLQFSWYLVVTGSFDGHNNEIGSAMRSTLHKQWIRFHVTRERITGYVIAMDDPAGLAGGSAVPRLLDVFALDAAPVAAPTPAPVEDAAQRT